MRVRRRRLLVGAVVATAAVTGAAAVASSRDGARGGTTAGDRAPADGRPRPGLAGLLELCATSRVVALTEGMHGCQDVYDLLAVAMLQPEFSIVDSIVVEWGNSLHQGVTDDYVSGALVGISRLQRIWRDTTQSPMNPLEHPTNFRLLSLARAANLFGARPRPLRVLLADPPIDWAGINDQTDYERFAADHSRTDSWVRVILDEVLAKGDRCITIGGGFHLLRRGYEFAGLDLPNVTDQIARRAPSGVSVIHTHASTMVGERIEEHLSGWPRPSIAEAAHTSMGAVPAVDVLPMPRQLGGEPRPTTTSNLTVADLADHILYLGRRRELSLAVPSWEVFYEPTYWAELARRRNAFPAGVPIDLNIWRHEHGPALFP